MVLGLVLRGKPASVLTAAGGPEPLRYAPSRSFVGQLIAINPAHRRQRLFAATLSSGRRGLRGPAPIAN
jgi:hypothetical protein